MLMFNKGFQSIVRKFGSNGCPESVGERSAWRRSSFQRIGMARLLRPRFPSMRPLERFSVLFSWMRVWMVFEWLWQTWIRFSRNRRSVSLREILVLVGWTLFCDRGRGIEFGWWRGKFGCRAAGCGDGWLAQVGTGLLLEALLDLSG